uniref:Uncharacterized protein n=1 Tax=Meloidogyne incognita TaxID=6306 RepID=A0A914MFG6_MELIC
MLRLILRMKREVIRNWAMVYAYQFTNITAIQLLNSFTIPAVMLLSCIFLSTRYKRGQFAAVAICLLGLGLTIYTDAIHDKGLNSGTNKFIGDFLCLIGTFLYAVSNVSEECLVKQYSR